jgi:Plasmid encoded RepA protein
MKRSPRQLYPKRSSLPHLPAQLKIEFQRLLLNDGLAPRAADEHPNLGFVSRLIVTTTLPHSEPADNEFVRNSGLYDLCLLTPRRVGLPYGRYPRLVLAWMITEAVRKRTPLLFPGSSLSNFASRLGITPSSGSKGTLAALREQIHRLAHLNFSCISNPGQFIEHGLPPAFSGAGVRLVAEHHLWWDDPPPSSEQPSYLRLSIDFFNEVIAHPIPIDISVIQCFRSPLEMDIYMWLTYRSIRASRINRPEPIPWKALESQFGADYAQPRMFRFNFLRALKNVLDVYPTARLSSSPGGLTLLPYPPHVPRQPKKR